MKQREYEEKVRDAKWEYFAFPAIVLIGMFGVGSIIDAFSHTTNTFNYIFTIIGGIPAIGYYYYSKFKKATNELNE